MKRHWMGVLLLMGALLWALPAPAVEGKVSETPQAQKSKAVEGPQATESKAGEATQAPKSKAGEATQAPEGRIGEVPKASQAKVGDTSKAYEGKIVDAKTQAPIAGALVTLGDLVVRTDQEGAFRLEGTGETLRLRAAGYKRQDVPTSELGNPSTQISLEPLKVMGLYLSVYGIASKKLREAALETLKRNNMNALVIDVKGDRGFMPFPVDLPLAKEVQAYYEKKGRKTILIKDMRARLASLKEKGIYLIARIVVFKDEPLAAIRPAWAVKKKGGGVFRDREKLRWIDAFRKEAWDYNIAIAKIAAEVGFDEIQFDYVRFPDTRGIVFSQPDNAKTRTKAITEFLKRAHKALRPYNVFVAADVFGYVPWNESDLHIGQQIVPIMDAVDIVSLMVYPSGYHLGIPKYRNPVKHPYQIVYQTHKKAQERTKASPLRFRPWLQAFRDYAFRGGDFKENRMRIQIKASDDFGASGWMFWNPRNKYPTGKFYSGKGAGKKSKPAKAQVAEKSSDPKDKEPAPVTEPKTD